VLECLKSKWNQPTVGGSKLSSWWK